MYEAVKKYAEAIIEKLNLFKLLQIAWLIEFHLLAICAALKIVNHKPDSIINAPPIIAEYMAKILAWFTEYGDYALPAAILALLVGCSGWVFTQIPFFSNYNLIQLYADFGLYAGSWLLIIYFTYKIFTWLGAWFLATPLLIWTIHASIHLLLEKIQKEVDLPHISFRTWE